MLRTLDAAELQGKRVLLRADLNVPLTTDGIADATRIRESVPTIQAVLSAGGTPIVMSHLGRPKGEPLAELSMHRLHAALSEALAGHEVVLATDCIGQAAETAILRAEKTGAVVLLENLRFHPGESANDPDFAEALARLGAIFVNDAFSTCHRAHASVTGITNHLPAYAGRLLQHEVERLGALLDPPKQPALAIIGGAKVDDKLAVVERLCERIDSIVLGGGVANTMLRATGFEIGCSLFDPSMVDTALRIHNAAAAHGCELLLPIDVVVASTIEAGTSASCTDIERVPSDQLIVDLGPRSIARIIDHAAKAATVVWAGPLGACDRGFPGATEAVARALACSTECGRLSSVVGGGETVAALEAFGLRNAFSHTSLAGGAFLEWLQNPALPGLLPLTATRH